MTHVYLSGPIIHADLRKEDFYEGIVKYLGSINIDVFAPQFLGPADAIEIYQRDINKLRDSNLLIGEVTNPSLGVGMELMFAIQAKIPMLLFRFQKAKPLSKMVLGAPGKALFDYTSLDDVIRTLERTNLDALKISSCNNCATEVASEEKGKLVCVKCKSPIPL